MKKNIQQVSAKDKQGKHILSVIVKRTYHIDDLGKCTLANEQDVINNDLIMHSDFPDVLIQDVDTFPYKSFTDVIVKGKARNASNKNSFISSIEIADIKHKIQIFGDRKVYKKNGIWKFSIPKQIEEIPLEYQFAYGGKDLIAEKPYLEKLEKLEELKYIIQEGLLGPSPFKYPRNPSGKGYVVEENNETIENLELPNIEDLNNLRASLTT